ncbi:hypothetical protein FKM82_020640 [Ascaphus truei]
MFRLPLDHSNKLHFVHELSVRSLYTLHWSSPLCCRRGLQCIALRVTISLCNVLQAPPSKEIHYFNKILSLIKPMCSVFSIRCIYC